MLHPNRIHLRFCDAGELVSSVTVDAEGSSGDHALSTIRYDYNDWGQRISMTSSVGANATYYYDQGNRLSRVKNQRGENFDFSYDNANRLTQIVRPGTKTSFDFDDGDFLTKISHGKVTSVEAVSFFIYVKDPAGNRTQMKTKPGNFDYSYDSNNQVVGATNPEASLNEFFQYDSIGNRTKDASGDIEYDSTKQRIQEDALFTYTHDNNGNLSSGISKTSDESVNYTHNSENQLIRIEFFKGAIKTKEVQYIYDALGRRIEKAVSDIQTPAKSFVRRYSYDGNEIIAERDGNEQTLARYTHSTLRTDDVLSVENVSGSYMYLKDGQGTITDITDTNGNLIQHYSYSAFGKILKITDASGNDVTQNPIINTPFTYTGREYDAESGLYYYRARYYEPALGRFLEQDPHPGDISNAKTHINKYIYAFNSPLNFQDPFGLWSVKGFLEDAGTTISGVTKSRELDLALAFTAGAAIAAAGVYAGNPAIVAAGAGMAVGSYRGYKNGNNVWTSALQDAAIWGVSAYVATQFALAAPYLSTGEAAFSVIGGATIFGEITGRVVGAEKWYGATVGFFIGTTVFFAPPPGGGTSPYSQAGKGVQSGATKSTGCTIRGDYPGNAATCLP